MLQPTPKNKKSRECADCNIKRGRANRALEKNQRIERPLLTIHRAVATSAATVPTSRTLNVLEESMLDMEADKENRDTYNLPLNYSQQFDTPTKRRTEFSEEKGDVQISLQIATPRKTRQMKEITNSVIVNMQENEMTTEKQKECFVQRIAQLNESRKERENEMELEKNEMELERNELQKQQDELQMQIDELYELIEIEKKRKKEHDESKNIIVRKAKKVEVTQRQVQLNCQKLMKVLEFMCLVDQNRMIDLITMCALRLNLHVIAKTEFTLTIEQLIYELALSIRKADKAAQLINKALGSVVIASTSTFYRNLKKKHIPVKFDSTTVGYNDIHARLDMLANNRPSSCTTNRLRISSDKGGGCIKTSVAFADTQSVRHVQILHVVAEDESYELMSTKVFSVYSQVQLWCTQHGIKLIACSDLKMTALLLGHIGHSANYPCTWCKREKTELHRLPVTSRDDLRSDNNILQAAQRMQRWDRKEQRLLGRQGGKLTATQKAEKADIKEECQSIERMPLDCIPLRDYAPAPMHVFIGIVNNVIEREWYKKLGKEFVRQILEDRNVYFGRYFGHSLSGNGVKNLLNCFDQILQDFHDIHNDQFTLQMQVDYTAFFENLLSIYRLCMRVKNLTTPQISRFAFLCTQYVSCRQTCMTLMHGNLIQNHRPFTPKEHTLLAHFEQFMLNHQSLGRYSEQSHEAIHHSFNILAEKYRSQHDFVDKIPLILRRLNEENLYLSNLDP